LTYTEFPNDHPRITPVTIVYFCYGWNLWLFLSWIPQYFLHSYNLDLKRTAVFASSVFFAGVMGDTLGGVVTDKLLKRTGNLKCARSWMVSVCMLLTLLALVPLLLTHGLAVSLASLCAGFFFAEMTIGPMWAIPMDIAPAYSGTALALRMQPESRFEDGAVPGRRSFATQQRQGAITRLSHGDGTSWFTL
jgi:ACS family glucarate transporter-like MFS transporter